MSLEFVNLKLMRRCVRLTIMMQYSRRPRVRAISTSVGAEDKDLCRGSSPRFLFFTNLSSFIEIETLCACVGQCVPVFDQIKSMET